MSLTRLKYTDHALASDGAVDKYRPVLLDSTGKLSTTLLPGTIKTKGTDNILRFQPGGQNTVDNDGTLTLNTAFTGFLFIMCSTDSSVALYGCDVGVTYELLDPETLYTVTKDNAATTNIYVESGNVILQNKRGGSRNYSIILFGTYGASF